MTKPHEYPLSFIVYLFVIYEYSVGVGQNSASFIIQQPPYTIPSINLFDYGPPSDGRYKYQITSSIIGETKINSSQQLNNGRMSQESRYKNINISQSGHFNFERGQIKLFNDTNDSNIAISR